MFSTTHIDSHFGFFDVHYNYFLMYLTIMHFEYFESLWTTLTCRACKIKFLLLLSN
jgi:hypothetical protein